MKKYRFDLNPNDIDNEFISDYLDGYELKKTTYMRMVLLAILKRISGIDCKNEFGEFYLDNKYLMEVSGFNSLEKMIAALEWLKECGFITRRRVGGNKPCLYTVTLVGGDCVASDFYNLDSRKGSHASQKGSGRVQKGTHKFQKGIQEEERDIPMFKHDRSNKEKEIKEKEIRDTTVEELRVMRAELKSLREQFDLLLSSIEVMKGSESPINPVEKDRNTSPMKTETRIDTEPSHTHDINEMVEVADSQPYTEDSDINGARAERKRRDRKDAMVTQCDRETWEKKKEATRLLNKLDTKSYDSDTLKRLYALESEGILTVPQRRMFWSIRNRDKKTDLYTLQWVMYSKLCEKRGEWVSNILLMDPYGKEEIKSAVMSVMAQFREEYCRNYYLLGDDENKFRALMNESYQTLYNDYIKYVGY